MIEAFAKIAEASKQLLETGFAPNHVNALLAQVGGMMKVDRVYVYENQPFPIRGRLLADARYGWNTAGVKSLQESTSQRQISLREVAPLWMEELVKGQAVSTGLLEAPPRMRLMMVENKTQALALAPIRVSKDFWGFVGFDDCQKARVWNAGELALLKSLAGGLATALRHQQMRSSLSQTRTQLAEMMLLGASR
ncbi:GAF domain-containing protein [Hyalangium rubrum]|uniref:GAF domain-containing protein n=1 Tax=Hyalangium rubrum TaxID=3103134 RepID=A0ABU5H1Y2_9BACT|nr:GAF domain-containing protein [Hyalangium sp. s54d21]MDY7226783.1 GAF domain-containing protein [Hyalangium sp. s54d21]